MDEAVDCLTCSDFSGTGQKHLQVRDLSRVWGQYVMIEKKIDELPLLTHRPIDNLIRGQVLIIYGGTKEKSFRWAGTKVLAENLAHVGFMTHSFDFRSNLVGHKFEDYGLYNRIQDARKVIARLLEEKQSTGSDTPISLIGVSMGGHIAVELAAEFGLAIKSLMLVVPAAYHHEAVKPRIKFGPSFKEKITRYGFSSREFADSQIFRRAQEIVSKTLIVAYENDLVVEEVPEFYWEALFLSPENKKFFWGPGDGHRGSFSNLERINFIANLALEYF